MIRKVLHKEIDFMKYNSCIQESQYPIVYANSWYLDLVTNKKWNVLVFDDYKAVMPLPLCALKRNLWQSKIIQPYFCQQLGIFAQHNLLEPKIKEFIAKFLSLSPQVYQFNTANQVELNLLDQRFTIKNNFILNLSPLFDEITKHYNQNTKRNIAKAKKCNLVLRNSFDIDEFIAFKTQNSQHKISKSVQKTLQKIINHSLKENQGEILLVQHNQVILASGFFLKLPNRLIYLVGSSTPKGKQFGSMHFLINSVIQKYANTKTILDFEGSEILGVKQFFVGFGAKNQKYLTFRA